MVKRMMGPSAVNASTLARQVGVSQPTLSQWLRAANSTTWSLQECVRVGEVFPLHDAEAVEATGGRAGELP
ncbi:hypothetical protein HUA76_33455 [Myxococcus sp. CA056]|nr:hypothetical protein [Myxococcus sp. CA056]